MSESDPSWPGDRGGHVWPKDREVVTDDGVHVRYAVRGPDDAPVVVLCAGYLCPDNFWTYLAPDLARHHRVVMLNYRGVGASTLPRDPGLLGRNVRVEDFRVERIARDVIDVVDAEDIGSATFLGHSMGCQVALEVYRQLGPGRVDSLVLVTGPFASPFDTFYGSSLGSLVFPIVYRSLQLTPEPLVRLIPRLARVPGMLDVAQLIRATGPATPRGPMQPYLHHLANVDAGVALKVAQAMHRHDARDVLPEVEVPALVIVGERDTFTPPDIGRIFVDEMPDAELMSVEGGTHCALLEYPGEVNHDVLDFLGRRVDPSGEVEAAR